MKITKQDIKTLEKIKKICDKNECSNCDFKKNKNYCILQEPPCEWRIDKINI